MSNRINRANSQIQKVLQQILHTEMNDPRIDEFVWINEVNVSPDFRFCKIKFTITNGDYTKVDNVLEALTKSEGFIKHKLSEMLDMPHLPKLNFIFDKNMQNALRVEQLLKSIKIPNEKENGDE